MSNETESEPFVKLNVSGRTIYNALKELLTKHYGISPDKIRAEVIQTAGTERIVKEWIESNRNWLLSVVRGHIQGMVERVIRDEVRAIANSRIKITIEQ